jgi:divalent metal cation (Fe/Co/Zn/Cd) transporter
MSTDSEHGIPAAVSFLSLLLVGTLVFALPRAVFDRTPWGALIGLFFLAAQSFSLVYAVRLRRKLDGAASGRDVALNAVGIFTPIVLLVALVFRYIFMIAQM